MTRAQRIAALRVTLAYRIISAEAALFLAKTPTKDLLTLVRKIIQNKLEDPDNTESKTERDILLAA